MLEKGTTLGKMISVAMERYEDLDEPILNP